MDIALPTQAHYEAQTAVIGCLLIEPEKLSGEIFHAVRGEDFADPAWRHLFEAAAALFRRGEKIDAVTVLSEAGAAYEPLVRQAMELTPTCANIASYLKLLRSESRLHRCKALAAAVGEAASAEEAAELLQQAEGLLTGREDARIVPFAQGYADFVTRLESKERPEYEDWGFDKLNEMVHARPGSYIVLGARTSVGKSALAAQFALRAAGNGKRVGMFSYEMADRDLYDRMGAKLARIEYSRITRRLPTEADLKSAYEIGLASGKLKLEVVEAAGYGVQDIRAAVLARRYEYIVVDYLQLVAAPGKNRAEAVTNVSIGLMSLCKSLGVTVLALSQFSRSEKTVKGKAQDKPTLSDLRESGQIEQDADVVMLLYRLNEADRQGPRWLEVAKNRNGMCGPICLAFDPRYLEFSPTDSRKYMGVAAESKPRGAKPETAVKPPKWTPIDGQEKMPF